MKQLTIFDVLPDDKPKTIPCGYTQDRSIVGKAIPFTELKNYIGRKIIKIENGNYKVLKVIEYIENSDTFWKRFKELPDNSLHYGDVVNSYIHDVCGIKECMSCYKPFFTCDRAELSDKENSDTANCYLSEAYCETGRFIYDRGFTYSIHEILTSGVD
jgi:hypothetical protein